MKYLICLIVFFSLGIIQAQSPHCSDNEFDQKVASYISGKIKVADVSTLKERQCESLILDAREYHEYAVSHIPGAIWIGYNKPNFDVLDTIAIDKEIYIYCSVGYRSDKLGQKIYKKGFHNISNVYGSIFEWANRSYPLVDENNQPTTQVHTYDKKWSKWVLNPAIEKVY